MTNEVRNRSTVMLFPVANLSNFGHAWVSKLAPSDRLIANDPAERRREAGEAVAL